MIDPSAGSGTFLIEYMKFITENMKYRNRGADGYNADLGTARAVKDKILSDWFYPNHRENKWAQIYIYGSEINFNLGTATNVFSVAFPNCFAFSTQPLVNPDLEKRKKCFF